MIARGRNIECKGCGAINPAGTYKTATGWSPVRWIGPCPSCGRMFPIVPQRYAGVDGSRESSEDGTVALVEVPIEDVSRLATGVEGLDFVLGGGVVPGNTVLICGPPGSGKSTLLSDVMLNVSNRRLPVLAIVGEESLHQMRARISRLNKKISKWLLVSRNVELEAVLEEVEKIHPVIFVVDSIQMINSYDDNGDVLRSGTPAAIENATKAIQRYAEGSGTAVFIVGHVTGALDAAGGKRLQHMVDVCLYMEHDISHKNYRWLRCPEKNRWGPTGPGAEAHFLMAENGLVFNPRIQEEDSETKIQDTDKRLQQEAETVQDSPPWSHQGLTEREVLVVACTTPDCRGIVDRACTSQDGSREVGFHDTRIAIALANKKGEPIEQLAKLKRTKR